MSELVKNKNGDWPKKKDLFSDGEINSDKILEVDFKDILNPINLREWFEKVNGQKNKDKEKA